MTKPKARRPRARKSLARRLLEARAPELRDLDGEAYLRRELNIPDDTTLEEHIASLTKPQRVALVQQLSQPILDDLDPPGDTT